MQIVRLSSLWLALVLSALAAFALGVVGSVLVEGGAWLALGGVLVALLALRRPLRRWRLARAPFPEAWRAWMARYVSFYRRLPPGAQARFERDVQFFVHEQSFEAAGEVELTDELRLSVAASAALLLYGRPGWEWPTRRTFLFYPGAFDEGYLMDDLGGPHGDFDGMAHEQGPVILSVPSVRAAWARPDDGSHVVLHELAHLFDFDADGLGVPSLMDPSSARAWYDLVQTEMRRVRLGHSLLRRYAAHDEAEFFAVAVENFFERPTALRRRHPNVFAALTAFFALDPRLPGATPEEAEAHFAARIEAGETDASA